MNRPNQRIGSTSNAHVGSAFEIKAKKYLDSRFNCNFVKNFELNVGININNQRKHKFDLGCSDKKIIVECKSHVWTIGDNVPSAKMTVLREALLYFYLTDISYTKVLFVKRSFSAKKNETLAQYFVRLNGNLIQNNVIIIEYDEENNTANDVWP